MESGWPSWSRIRKPDTICGPCHWRAIARGCVPGSRRFLQTPADERTPAFSPDGRWMAYVSDESGTYQVYVRAFRDKGGKWQISDSGGMYPMWSRTGHELFFEA